MSRGTQICETTASYAHCQKGTEKKKKKKKRQTLASPELCGWESKTEQILWEVAQGSSRGNTEWPRHHPASLLSSIPKKEMAGTEVGGHLRSQKHVHNSPGVASSLASVDTRQVAKCMHLVECHPAWSVSMGCCPISKRGDILTHPTRWTNLEDAMSSSIRVH